jgi:hypothetical protein
MTARVWMVKDYDDVLFPARAANLQPPGPSNPGGAPYVILRDFPDLSEIANRTAKRLLRPADKEELEKLTGTSSARNSKASPRSRKTTSGTQEQPGSPQDASHKKLTRLMCFDTLRH